MKNYFTFLLVLLLLITSCNATKTDSHEAKNTATLTGLWLGKLQIKPGKNLPFNFEISEDSIFFYNGQEKIQATLSQSSDSIYNIKMPVFNSEFNFKINSNKLEGEWKNYSKGSDYIIPFCAVKSKNINSRFTASSITSPSLISGKWEVAFAPNKPNEFKAIGAFNQNNNNLTGTFITETGDYRFLQGNTINDSIFLSCFDGSHAFLFEAKLENEELTGVFYSGNHYQESWKAIRNSNFQLTNPDSITTINYENPIAFSFPDLDSNIVSFPSERFSNKVLIVQIIGSWCPNCLDETAFFNSLYNKYHSEGLEVISLAYEKPLVFSEKVKSIQRLKNHFNAKYPFLIAGHASKKEVEKSLPFLKNVASFPTTIYIDKNGKIRKVYSGFYGPGTGSFFTNFSNETTNLIKTMLNENFLN